jgi:hypothetical protein
MLSLKPRRHRTERKCRPGALQLEVRRLLTSVSILNPSGPITAITVGGDGSFQVRRADFLSGQAFPNNRDPADAGLFVRQADGTVVGFDAVGRAATAYRTGATSTRSVGLFPLSLQLSADGNRAILVGDNRSDGNTLGQHFQITQINTYHPGDDYFRTDATIINLGLDTITLDLFAGADLYLADQDRGVGFYNPDTGAIGGQDLTGTYKEFVQPNVLGGLTPTGYQGGHFLDIWQRIGDGRDLTNFVRLPSGAAPWTTDDLSYTDNGAALEWQDVTIGPAQSARISYFWSFGGSQDVAPDPPPVTSPVSIQATTNQAFDKTIATFTSTNPILQPSDFLATVYWGDGSPLELARVSANPSGPGFAVLGSHTYTQTGVYSVLVSVVSPQGGAGTVRSQAFVSGGGTGPPGPSINTIAGDLARSSDTGVSNSDHITRENRPRFEGTGTPASQWTLRAVSTVPGSQPIALGTTTVDAAGNWSLQTTDALADGSYLVDSRLVGAPAGMAWTALIDASRPLVIDTVGPQVSGLVVVPKDGTLKVSLQDDRTGLDARSLGDVRNYRLTRRSKGKTVPIGLAVAQSMAAAGAGTSSVTLSAGGKLADTRSYVFSVSPGVTDVAGNGLAGEFTGTFPTGKKSNAASFFDANIQISHQKVVAIKPIRASVKRHKR